MAIETAYYNYYNVSGRYSPQTPEKPQWKKDYEVTENKIQSKNNSQDSDRYKAYTKLEETYYSVSVSNRAKYSTKSELVSALQKKYFQDDTYSQYDYSEKDAMLLNEMNMTLYGCLNSGGNVNDPHLRGNVRDSSESEKQLYNRKMVNVQIGNLLSSGGINTDLLGNSKLKFSIDPYDFSLKVSGVDDEKISDQIEKILNSGNNSKELFYHIIFKEIAIQGQKF